MRGEKEVAAEKELADDDSPIVGALGLRREGADVSKRNESRADQEEQGHAVHCKRDSFWMRKNKKCDKRDKKQGAYDKDAADIKGGNIGENDICHRVTRTLRRIAYGKK